MEKRVLAKYKRVSIYIPEEFFVILSDFDRIIKLDKTIDINNVKQVQKVDKIRSVALRQIIKKYVEQINKKISNINTIETK